MTNQPAGQFRSVPATGEQSRLVTKQYTATSSSASEELRVLLESDLDFMISECSALVAGDHASQVKQLQDALEALAAAKKKLVSLLTRVSRELERSRTQGPDTYVGLLEEAQRALAGQLRAKSEQSETTLRCLQKMMDRHSEVISTLSNMLKKIGETQQAVIHNLK